MGYVNVMYRPSLLKALVKTLGGPFFLAAVTFFFFFSRCIAFY